MSRAAEVAWGENAEVTILKRWLSKTQCAPGAARVIRSEGYDDYDFLLLDKRGLPVAYVEIKKRRSPLARFGDALFPYRKHEFAKRLAAFNIPFVGVTLYGCGALVEVDLTKRPSKTRDIVRHDRSGDPPVKHGIYSRRQLLVLDEGVE